MFQSGTKNPNHHDVLCGRGNGVQKHLGNIIFRKQIKHMKETYANCAKREKIIHRRKIYDTIQNQEPPGRFLKMDEKTNLWLEISENEALEKIGRALRENRIASPSFPKKEAKANLWLEISENEESIKLGQVSFVSCILEILNRRISDIYMHICRNLRYQEMRVEGKKR